MYHSFFINDPVEKCEGYCNICNKEVDFVVPVNFWEFRDNLVCPTCGSIPRERALMFVIELLYPNWKNLAIHESSPIGRGASKKIKTDCSDYTATQFYPKLPFGSYVGKFRNENLEKQTFEDEVFDLVISQDVMEHVFFPDKAFSEIARTLKPGGAHIFTVPIVNRERPSTVCAKLLPNGKVEHLKEPEYHGNPVDSKGSLVTMNWGFDITDYIKNSSGLNSTIYFIDNLKFGIRALYIEVIVTRKP